MEYCAFFSKEHNIRDGYISKEEFAGLAQDELGLKWKEFGSGKQFTGTEIKNGLFVGKKSNSRNKNGKNFK